MKKERLDTSAVRIADDIIAQAVKARASDIHFDPRADKTIVKIRVDGVLRRAAVMSREQWNRVLMRLKVISGMDLTEHKKPQDGSAVIDADVSLRVSTLPTVYGEKVVIRLLDSSRISNGAESLGLEGMQLDRFHKLVGAKDGLILIAGPAGAGKSSTLYEMLRELTHDSVNIVTLEEPVEYNVVGANQVAVNERVGMTFSAGMRAMLRQDPDVIAIGEIRDAETAETACQAAITGYLILATVHVRSASSLPDRMKHFGVKTPLMKEALRGVIVQRLVRRVCTDCHGDGCEACGKTGYRGRTGVFGIVTFASGETVTPERLREADAALAAHCRSLAARGVTTESEVERVLGTI